MSSPLLELTVVEPSGTYVAATLHGLVSLPQYDKIPEAEAFRRAWRKMGLKAPEVARRLGITIVELAYLGQSQRRCDWVRAHMLLGLPEP